MLISLVAIGLAGVLVFPVYYASADNFTITTSRPIYSPDEKIVVLGTVPENAPSDKPVLISIVSEDGAVCKTSKVLPSDDGNFISRPIEISACKVGHYEAKASYGDLTASASFTISTKGTVDPSAILEIRIIKDILKESGDLANAKVQALLRTGANLPANIAASYEQGVAESSAALRSADYGDRDTARSHMVNATSDFRSVVIMLSSMESQNAYADFASLANDTLAPLVSVNETMSKLSHYADWLNQLAAKNGFENDTWFGNVSSLLGQANGLLGVGDIQGAREKLSQATDILESVRMDLMDNARESIANSTLSSSSPDNVTKTKLYAFANMIESRANLLLNKSIPQSAHDRLEQVLALVAQAKTDLANNDFQHAKKALAVAFSDLNDVRKTIEKSHGHGGHDGNSSGSNSTSGQSNDNSNSTNNGSGNSDSNQTQSSGSQSGNPDDNSTTG